MDKDGVAFREWLERLKGRSRIEINEDILREVSG